MRTWTWTVGNLKKTKRTISIVAGFSRNTKQSTNEKLNLIPVDIQKADKCAKIAKTDTGKGPRDFFVEKSKSLLKIISSKNW